MTKLIIGVNDLQTLYTNIAKELDISNNITPDKILPGSHKKYLWRCSKNSNHIWKSPVYVRTIMNCGCPYCSHRIPEIGVNDLKTLYPDIAEEFCSKLNHITPDKILPCSNKKYYWKCSHGHIWKSTANNRIALKQGCPYCSNQKVLSGYNDLQTKFPEIAKEFASDLNNITPDKILSGTPKKYYWRCQNNPNHIWKTSVNNRTNPNHLSNCPYCSHFRHSIPEKLLYNIFRKYYDSNVQLSKIIDNKEYDLYLSISNTLLEYDGSAFHSESGVFSDKTYLKRCENTKNIVAKNNNFNIIRIIETKNIYNYNKFSEIIDGVNIYYISDKYDKEYFQRLSKIIKNITGITIDYMELRQEFKNIKLGR